MTTFFATALLVGILFEVLRIVVSDMGLVLALSLLVNTSFQRGACDEHSL